jgi:hypothetical protein
VRQSGERVCFTKSNTKVSLKVKVLDTNINIRKVEKDHEDGILVTFSDGTTAGYIVEELLMLRPLREPDYGPSMPARSSTVATNAHSISAFNFEAYFTSRQVNQRAP